MALLNTYQDAEFALSLRRLFSSYYGPLVRVIRESDLVEVDVLPDSNGEISYDSSLSRPEGTLAYTLGQFLNIDGYTDADSLGSVYEGRLITIYDQSVGANHVSYDTFSNAFIFVEHSLPAIFPNSTGIIKVSGVPSFFAVGTSKTFTPYTLLGTEYSIHFLSGQIGSNPIGFRVQGIDTNGFFTSPYDVLLYTNLATTVFQPSGSTDVFDVNNVYINTEQCTETQNNVFAKPTGQNEDTVINSIEFAFFDNATTQANFSAAVDGPSFYIVANSFYADIIVYEGYNNTRRIAIEDLYSSAADNTETKAFTSTLAFNEDNFADNSFIAQFGAPAAAYSVRDLRGGVDDQGDRVTKIMRVRREIDHAEADVYPDSTGWLSLNSRVEIVPAITGNLEGGTGDEINSQAVTLGGFVNDPDYDNPDNLVSATTAKVVVWYDQSDPDYLVDNLPESIQERGAPIRIRVIGGTYNNYEFDVYFDNNETISLSSYVADTYEITDSNGQVTAAISNGTLQTLLDAGMTEAAVCVWYDQSGSGNDASQDVSSSQPKIVSERTNLLLQSNSFDNWSNNSVFNLTSGQSGYDGGSDAWLFDKPVANNSYLTNLSNTATSPWTFSVYAKSNTLGGFIVAGAFGNAIYNLDDGQVVSNTSVVATIDGAGNGWWRCSFYSTTSISTENINIQPRTKTGGTNVTGSIYIQDAQLETGSSATDYIETTTSAVSVSEVVTENGKAALAFDGINDGLSLDTSGLDIGSMSSFAVGKYDTTGGNQMLLGLSSGTANKRWYAPYLTGTTFNYGYATTFDAMTATANTNINLHTMIAGSTLGNAEAFLNASSLGTATLSSGVSTVTNEIMAFGNAFYADGKMQEVIIYDSDQSTNRTGIESNINGYYDIYGSGNTGVNTPLLDTYSDAAAAYSLRKLRTSYNGPVNLSKRKDAIQNVATAQPTIYNGGLIAENGKPALRFDGVNDYFTKAFTLGNPVSHFVVSKATNQGEFILDGYGAGNLNSLFLSLSALDTIRLYNLSGITASYTLDTQALFSSISNGASSLLAVNGTSTTGSLGTQHMNGVTIGCLGTLYIFYCLDGTIQEVILYGSAESTNRIDIENNINSAFQIYAANFSSVLDSVPLAKAAYSIRRLTKNYIGPIITVTNGSTTKDFYADFWGNLDVDALTSFANGGTLSVTKWWDQSGEGVHLLTTSTRPTLTIANNEVSVNTTNKFYEPLLDRYEGAAAAYSLRILKGDYTGPLVRVRRDGTHTEVDVYPDENLTISLNSPVLNVAEATTDVTANPLDTLATTLGEFVADAGFSDPDSLGAPVSAFVVVWYDQANSNNASQDISTSQPKICTARTNLLLQSNQFDTTPWNTTNATLTESQTGYDGSTDAWLLENVSAASSSSLFQSISTTGQFVFSVYAKAGTTNWIRLNMSGVGNQYFDIQNGTVGVSGGMTGYISDVGNGWFRCSITGSGSSTGVYVFLASADGDISVNSSDNVYIQDAQLETGSSATGYIETTTSAASGSEVVTENGKPVIQGVTGNYLNLSSDIIGSGDFSIYTASTRKSNDMLYGGNSPIYGVWAASSNLLRSRFANPNTEIDFSGTLPEGDLFLSYFNRSGNNAELASNGETAATATLVSSNDFTVKYLLVGNGVVSFNYEGQIFECVFYDSNQTTNRTGIESNINNYYSIYTGFVPEQQTVAVYNNAINTTVDLNATYTDLKEIIKYE